MPSITSLLGPAVIIGLFGRPPACAAGKVDSTDADGPFLPTFHHHFSAAPPSVAVPPSIRQAAMAGGIEDGGLQPQSKSRRFAGHKHRKLSAWSKSLGGETAPLMIGMVFYHRSAFFGPFMDAATMPPAQI
ncbi:hypothetical protein [Alcanivorax sp.]|uniref:hypothetical protein n=1 Tax=Alcanivorax sp. TaxID=1872427 RepID=UPI0025B8B789|nr:hypothetical protein [Alcanivorax sp.]